MTNLYQFPNLGLTSTPFRNGIVALAERLATNPNFLLAVMVNESGLKPWAVNPVGGATGLIQWMPKIAPLFGTTTTALRCMTDVEQLPYVEKFYKPYRGKIDSAGTAYMLTFLPKFANESDEFVLGKKGDDSILYGTTTRDKVYAQNPGFDRTKKGWFTVADVKWKANSTLQAARARGTFVETSYVDPEATRGKDCPAPLSSPPAAPGASGPSSPSGASAPGSTSSVAGPWHVERVSFPVVEDVARVADDWWKPIQRRLGGMGLYPGPIDGDPGPKTMRALARVGLDVIRRG